MPTLPGPTVITGGSGGGFQIGSSYLAASSGIVTPLSGGGASGAFPWTLDDLDGADMSINGGDNTLIDVATAGWYVISLHGQFDSNGAEVFASMEIQSTTDPVNFMPYWPQRAGVGTVGTRATVTTGPTEVGAGGQITMFYEGALVGGTGTWRISEAFIEITRVS